MSQAGNHPLEFLLNTHTLTNGWGFLAILDSGMTGCEGHKKMIWVKFSKQIGCEPESKQEETHLVLAHFKVNRRGSAATFIVPR